METFFAGAVSNVDCPTCGNGGAPSSRLIYEGSGSPYTAQSSVAKALSDVLSRAHLLNKEGVGIKSFRAYAARQAFEKNKHIEDAAHILGVRSLDQAARIICFDWKSCE